MGVCGAITWDVSPHGFVRGPGETLHHPFRQQVIALSDGNRTKQNIASVPPARNNHMRLSAAPRNSAVNEQSTPTPSYWRLHSVHSPATRPGNCPKWAIPSFGLPSKLSCLRFICTWHRGRGMPGYMSLASRQRGRRFSYYERQAPNNAGSDPFFTVRAGRVEAAQKWLSTALLLS